MMNSPYRRLRLIDVSGLFDGSFHFISFHFLFFFCFCFRFLLFSQVKHDLPNAVVYSSLEAALDDPGVHLVVIGSPSGDHEKMAIQALNKGRFL